MAVRTDFVAGEVLAAQDLDDTFASKINYALPVNAQTGTAYTFVLADGLRLTTASNAAASTYTIPPQASVAWLANSVIRIVNYGAGTVTIAGGAGVTVTNATKTLAQFESAALIRTASNAWTLVPFSGAGNADFSNTATGTYTDGGIAYKYITYTGSGTLTVTRAGFADVLIIGGGGPGGQGGEFGNGGGGGAGGHLYITDAYLPTGSLTVIVGAGGTVSQSTVTERAGKNGRASRLGPYYVEGGGFGGVFSSTSFVVGDGGSGGGGRESAAGGTGTSGVGNNGGTAGSAGGGGGGAGAAGTNGSGSVAGAGGAGLANSITGTSVTRAGGGGATGVTPANGGSGGGGNGSNGTGGNGTVNTGGGGGGGGAGGLGGSGVVIVRVRT